MYKNIIKKTPKQNIFNKFIKKLKKKMFINVYIFFMSSSMKIVHITGEFSYPTTKPIEVLVTHADENEYLPEVEEPSVDHHEKKRKAPQNLNALKKAKQEKSKKPKRDCSRRWKSRRCELRHADACFDHNARTGRFAEPTSDDEEDEPQDDDPLDCYECDHYEFEDFDSTKFFEELWVQKLYDLHPHLRPKPQPEMHPCENCGRFFVNDNEKRLWSKYGFCSRPCANIFGYYHVRDMSTRLSSVLPNYFTHKELRDHVERFSMRSRQGLPWMSEEDEFKCRFHGYDFVMDAY